MTRFSTHLIAVLISVLALGAFQAVAVPPTPSWVVDLCADRSPCISTPSNSYEGLAFARQYLMPDPTDSTLPWVECPALPSGAYTQATCVGGVEIAHWLVLTRGGPAHIPIEAFDHDVYAVVDSPIYGPGGGLSQGVLPPYARGAVMAFHLSPLATASQAPPDVPPGDPVLWEAWYRRSFPAACLADPVCNGGASMTPAQFETMLQASSFGSAVYPVTFTQPDGTQVTVTSGTQQ